MVDLFMINLHMQYKVRVRFVLSWEGCVCCDTLLSDTIVLTPRLTILRVSLFSGFHFAPMIGILRLGSVSHCYLSLYSFIQSLDIGKYKSRGKSFRPCFLIEKLAVNWNSSHVRKVLGYPPASDNLVHPLKSGC